ncbi:PREDICTED: uncharacterized protein LOC105361215 [Ceratosolen solmsi marchali]|uniref:Uncharacterized protein LOC105361215 n=1 Tax=Ceratosolen solmsi marchali TaxID=326594 RepID=A0AAJ6YEK3_9HYME|nr:PREDICTED: uncharacterized protein LOC105361215 [Ceratosolen solmsi marchali]
MKNAFVQDIKQLEVFSRLSANSKNNLLKVVHNLLLLKLKPTEMLEKYKMYEHILPLLEYISSEVIFAMNFMFDLKRIEALHLLSIDNERINFMVASRKANIILKVSLIIKIFKEIGPNDINVACILGDIRKTDIMQLIINIKRDYKFLSRYINDIKDYITLMEESTCLNR